MWQYYVDVIHLLSLTQLSVIWVIFPCIIISVEVFYSNALRSKVMCLRFQRMNLQSRHVAWNGLQQDFSVGGNARDCHLCTQSIKHLSLSPTNPTPFFPHLLSSFFAKINVPADHRLNKCHNRVKTLAQTNRHIFVILFTTCNHLSSLIAIYTLQIPSAWRLPLINALWESFQETRSHWCLFFSILGLRSPWLW